MADKRQYENRINREVSRGERKRMTKTTYKYFVSYAFTSHSQQSGFGRGIIESPWPIKSFDDIKEVEDYIKSGAAGVASATVTLLNFQLLSISTAEGPQS
jgi:hypothetical protein